MLSPWAETVLMLNLKIWPYMIPRSTKAPLRLEKLLSLTSGAKRPQNNPTGYAPGCAPCLHVRSLRSNDEVHPGNGMARGP